MGRTARGLGDRCQGTADQWCVRQGSCSVHTHLLHSLLVLLRGLLLAAPILRQLLWPAAHTRHAIVHSAQHIVVLGLQYCGCSAGQRRSRHLPRERAPAQHGQYGGRASLRSVPLHVCCAHTSVPRALPILRCVALVCCQTSSRRPNSWDRLCGTCDERERRTGLSTFASLADYFSLQACAPRARRYSRSAAPCPLNLPHRVQLDNKIGNPVTLNVDREKIFLTRKRVFPT